MLSRLAMAPSVSCSELSAHFTRPVLSILKPYVLTFCARCTYCLVGYYFTIAAVVVFLLTGFDGSPTHKFMHKKLYPEDRPPPTCGRYY